MMANLGSSKRCRPAAVSGSTISSKKLQLHDDSLDEESSSKSNQKAPNLPFAVRHRDDLVGKRIICLPRTFDVATLSPTQISSSLWSAETLAALKELASDDDEVLRAPCWCPIHHHHQDSQHNLVNILEGRRQNFNKEACNFPSSQEASEQSSKRIRARQQTSGQKNSPNNLNRQSYSVMRSANQAKLLQSENVSGNRLSSPLSIQNRHSINTSYCSSCELCDNEAIENELDRYGHYLSSLPWRIGTVRAVSHRNLDDKALNLMIEFDLLDWETRDWYQVHTMSKDDDDVPEDSRSTDNNHQTVFRSDASSVKNQNTGHKIASDNSRRLSNLITSCEYLVSELPEKKTSARIGKNGINSDKGKIFETKTSVNDDDPSQGVFSVLLIESSICCVRRKNSPIGRHKLWPALIFEPLVDNLGLFDSGSMSLIAVEYFDPGKTHHDNKQSICDIEAITSEIKNEISAIVKESDQSDGIKSRQMSFPNDECVRRYSGETACVANSGDHSKCKCWSPKVEFVLDSIVYKLRMSEITTGLYNFDKLNDTHEDPMKNSKKSSCKTINHSNKPGNDPQLTMAIPLSDAITCCNINSFKRFLRFFHFIQINIRTQRTSSAKTSTRQMSDADTNDLLDAIVLHPELYNILREWHMYQDAQSLLGNVYTAAFLVGNRVRVYRYSGTTQWYTAVIISYDERTNLMTLIDDTVLEEHHEDPTLLEMHLIDDGLIQSIIEGDDITRNSSTRRRAQRTNQRQAAQTAQMAIMNSSMTTSNGSVQSGAGSIEISKQQTKRDKFPLAELDTIKGQSDESNFISPFNALSTTPSTAPTIRLGGLSRGATIDGKNFLSHRLRLEALEGPISVNSSEDEIASSSGVTISLPAGVLENFSNSFELNSTKLTGTDQFDSDTRTVQQTDTKDPMTTNEVATATDRSPTLRGLRRARDLFFRQHESGDRSRLGLLKRETGAYKQRVGENEIENVNENVNENENESEDTNAGPGIEEGNQVERHLELASERRRPTKALKEVASAATVAANEPAHRGSDCSGRGGNVGDGHEYHCVGQQRHNRTDERPRAVVAVVGKVDAKALVAAVETTVAVAAEAATTAAAKAAAVVTATSTATVPNDHDQDKEGKQKRPLFPAASVLAAVGNSGPASVEAEAEASNAIGQATAAAAAVAEAATTEIDPIGRAWLEAKGEFEARGCGGGATVASRAAIPSHRLECLSSKSGTSKDVSSRPESGVSGGAEKQQRHNRQGSKEANASSISSSNNLAQVDDEHYRALVESAATTRTRSSSSGSGSKQKRAHTACRSAAEEKQSKKQHHRAGGDCDGQSSSSSSSSKSSNNHQRLQQHRKQSRLARSKVHDDESRRRGDSSGSNNDVDDQGQAREVRSSSAILSLDKHLQPQLQDEEREGEEREEASSNAEEYDRSPCAPEAVEIAESRDREEAGKDANSALDTKLHKSDTEVSRKFSEEKPISFNRFDSKSNRDKLHQKQNPQENLKLRKPQLSSFLYKEQQNLECEISGGDNSFDKYIASANDWTPNIDQDNLTKAATKSSDQPRKQTFSPNSSENNEDKHDNNKLEEEQSTTNSSSAKKQRGNKQFDSTSSCEDYHHQKYKQEQQLRERTEEKRLKLKRQDQAVTLEQQISFVPDKRRRFNATNNATTKKRENLNLIASSTTTIATNTTAAAANCNNNIKNHNNNDTTTKSDDIALLSPSTNSPHQQTALLFGPSSAKNASSTLSASSNVCFPASDISSVPWATLSSQQQPPKLIIQAPQSIANKQLQSQALENISNQFKHQQTLTLLNHHDQHPNAARSSPPITSRYLSNTTTSAPFTATTFLAEGQASSSRPTQAHLVAMHNFGPNSQEQNKSDISRPNNNSQQQLNNHQQFLKTSTAATVDNDHSALGSGSALDLQSPQHYGSYNSRTSAAATLQSYTLASRVDHIIRTTLHDSLQMPKSTGSNNNNNHINMPSSTTTTSSSMIFNPVSLPVSSSQNFNAPTGLMSAHSPLTSYYGSTMSTVDTLNNNIIINSSNSKNNPGNLSNKIPAHSDSHSTLAAAAALQSLNQSNLQRSHQLAQFQQSSRPPSNSLTNTPMHANSFTGNNNMPKLGITSTTSSDHQNHKHLALPSHQMDNQLDFNARFLQKPGIRHPLNWQDQQELGSNPRWLYGQYNASYSSPNFPTSSPSLPTSAVSNLSNTNNMIGQDGDNQASMRSKNERQSTSSNLFSAKNLDPMTMGMPNQTGHGYPWLESLKGSNVSLDASKAQSQRISAENSERLGVFTFNLLSTCIPGTNKPKKVITLDSITELRQSIYCGEFYTKFEDIALAILTNQVFVPEFSIIDYIRREKFSMQELERIESVHKRLGASNFLYLMELAQQRPHLPMMKNNDIKASHSDTSCNLNTSIYQQSFNHQIQGMKSAYLPPPTGHKSDANMLGADKGIRSSQSPSDILYRSQPNNNPRLFNAHSSPAHQSYLGTNPSMTGSHSGPPAVSQRNTNPSHARFSPFQPISGQNQFIGLRPPRSNSTIGMAHEPPMAINASVIRQPPAAHQSSSRPNIVNSSLNVSHTQSSSSITGPPVSAHMSSKTPHTPRTHNQESLSSPASRNNADNHSPGRIDDRHTKSFGIPTSNSQSNFSSKSDIDTTTGLPVHTLLSLRQQDLVNRDISMKRVGTPNYQGNNGNDQSFSGIHLNNDVSKSPGGMDSHVNSKSPMNSQSQPIYGSPQLSNFNNGSMFKPMLGTNFPNMSAPSSMPPPSLDYHHKTMIQSDLIRNNEARASAISPNINSLPCASEAQLKQYSALMSAYQQQHMMMTNKPNINLGPSSSLPIGLGSNSLSGSIQPPLHSPQGLTESIHLDLQNQQQSNSSYGESRLSSMNQQQSPKQSIQRSIITGSASTVGPKRGKKAKHSPPGSQTVDSKTTSPEEIPPTSGPATSKSNSLSDCDTQIFSSEKFAELPRSSVESDHTSCTRTDDLSHPGLTADRPPSSNPDVTAAVRAALCEDSESSSNVQSAAHPSEQRMDLTRVNPSDENTAQGSHSLNDLKQNNNDLKDTLVDGKSCNQKNDNFACAVDDTAANKLTHKLDIEPTNQQISAESSSAITSIVEPSKYQKLYTKKAWLKNYDQEDQARSKISTDNPTTASKIEAKSETMQDTRSAQNKIEQKDVKASKAEPAKKKAKENTTKKVHSIASSRASRAVNKAIENESELSNASTSELDSDETASLKSTSYKALRRMPRRKVKPSSDKEELQSSPKSKSSKDVPPKRGRRDKIIEDLNNKRKRNADEDQASKRGKKVKHQSSKSKQEALKTNSADEGENSNASTQAELTSKLKSSKKLKKKSNANKTAITSPHLSPMNDESSHQMDVDDDIDDRTVIREVHKRTGEKFLQADPCYDIVPRSIQCLECRRVRQSSLKNDKVVSSKQSTKTNWDDFCRFYEFRKLRYNKSSQIVVAGFSDLDDARESDKTLWIPHSKEAPKNLTYNVAKFILANVGKEFCNLVMQERAARDSYRIQNNGDKKITWKRAVNGLRELCDVCATTLFNCHHVCERCGFVVCIDCYLLRSTSSSTSCPTDSERVELKKEVDESIEKSTSSSKNVNDTSENAQSEKPEQPVVAAAKKNKRDQFGWIYCAKNEEHTLDKLILAQIIAGDCLEEVWQLLHQVRQRLSMEPCGCEQIIACESSSLNILPVKIENPETVDTKDPLTNEQSLGGPTKQENESQDATSEGSHSTLKGLLLASHSNYSGAPNGDDKTSTNDEEKPEEQLNSGKIKDEKISSNENITRFSACSSPLHGDKMFNDSSNEDDSQEDSKLSQQVTAAIEGCISSLPNGSNEVDIPESEIPTEKTKSQEDTGTKKNGPNTESETHSWLCDGDLLILLKAKHRMNVELFGKQWRQGKPVLVRGVDRLMKIDMWLPQFFGKEFGDYRSDLVDCRNGDIHRHSMKKYWEGFEPTNGGGNSKKKVKDDSVPVLTSSANNEELSNGPSYYSGSALWRLKDWPPGQDFYEILPSHYEDFMNNLPLRSYTTRSGKLNLACRLPKEMLKPDLGPKMYSAYGTSKFPERGTTNLHLDISDAINVMVYVSGATSFNNGSEEHRDVFDKTIDECFIDAEMKRQIREDKLVPGALWHIFRPSDASKVRDFLNKVSDERNISPQKRNDPIHDQTWYLDQTLLDRLYREHSVKSYPILQCMGDAILIPAGAPHQVKNVQNCIKVANDFVSPENVRFCLQLTNEFRSLPETHINQEDKLQIKNILYHSVKESLQYIQLHEAGELNHSEISDEDHNVDMDSH